MQSISKCNKGVRFLNFVIDIYSRYAEYAWIFPIKDKKGTKITNAFQKTFHESGRKPNKIWVEQCSEFYNGSMKSWLHSNDIETYLSHNEYV